MDSKKNKIYIAGPMRGYPEFNFPAFHTAAYTFRKLGWEVFNPAERDENIHGKDFGSQFPTGSIEEAAKKGFSLRDALCDDLSWICKEATAIYMLKGWEKSNGARAEHQTAIALDLRIIYE